MSLTKIFLAWNKFPFLYLRGERGRGTQKGENRTRVENESGRGEK
jgi:hypothetical protein